MLVEMGSAPELSAPSARLSAFATHLTASGWEVVTRGADGALPAPRRGRDSPRLAAVARCLASMARAEGDVRPSLLRDVPHVARQVRSDVVLVSVPPFSALLLPTFVSAHTRVVIDVRDPWLHNLRLPVANAATRRLEAHALRRADAITFAGTEALGDRLSAMSGLKRRRVVAAANGVVPSDVPDASVTQPDGGPLDLVFAGSVYGSHQLRLVAREVARLGPRVAQLEIIGPSPERQVRRVLGSVKPPIVVSGPLPRPELYTRLLAADLLILALPDSFPYAFSIPVKAYEYFALGVPVLAVAPCHSPVLSLADATQIHRVDPGDRAGARSTILRLASQRSLLTRRRVRSSAFSRLVGAGELLRVLDDLCPATPETSVSLDATRLPPL